MTGATLGECYQVAPGRHAAMEDQEEFEAPSGIREGTPPELEVTPLGTESEQPEGEGETPRGPDAMPGIPTEGEPPNAG
jgi:hypothetical protein